MKIKIILDIRTVQASSPLSGWLEIQKSPTQKYVFSLQCELGKGWSLRA